MYLLWAHDELCQCHVFLPGSELPSEESKTADIGSYRSSVDGIAMPLRLCHALQGRHAAFKGMSAFFKYAIPLEGPERQRFVLCRLAMQAFAVRGPRVGLLYARIDQACICDQNSTIVTYIVSVCKP